MLGAIKYRVQVSNEDDEVIVDENIEDNEMKVDDLSPGSQYQVRIASIDTFKRQSKDWSSIFTFVTSKFKLFHFYQEILSNLSFILRTNLSSKHTS